MGEGGIDPHYFLYEMEYWECQYYIDGYNRRYRPIYTVMRWLIHSIAGMFCEKGKIPDDPIKFYQFPWEEESDTETEDSLDDNYAIQMQELIRIENEKLARE